MDHQNLTENTLRRIYVELAKKERLENQILELDKQAKEVKGELGKVKYFLKDHDPDRLKKIKSHFQPKSREAKETPREMAENALLDLKGEGKAEVIFKLMRKKGYRGNLSAAHSVLQRAHQNRRCPIKRLDGDVGYYTYDPKDNIVFNLV